LDLDKANFITYNKIVKTGKEALKVTVLMRDISSLVPGGMIVVREGEKFDGMLTFL